MAWLHDPWPALKLLLRVARGRLRPATPPHPRYWSVETTDACNARCVFCTYPAKKVDGRPLELGSFTTFLDWAASRGIRTLQFTPLTGEAFADPGLLDKLELASSRGFDAFLYTNGSLLHRFDLEELLDCRLVDIRISFGGFSPEAYRESFGVDLYARVLENLEALLTSVERRAQRGARVPRVELSLRSVRTVEVELRSPDYKRCLVRHVDAGRLEILPQEWYDSFGGFLRELPGAMRVSRMPEMTWVKRHHPCWFLGTMGLGSRGEIRLCNCVMSAGADGRNQLVVGHIEDGLDHAEREAVAIRERWRSGALPASCRRCQNYEPTTGE